MLLVLAVIDLLRIRAELNRGRDALKSLDFSSVDQQGNLTGAVNGAAAHLAKADHLADTSPWLGFWSHVPLVDDQVSAIRDVTATARDVGTLGQHAADRVQTALDRASTQGPEGRVPLVDTIASTVADLRSSLKTISIPDRRWLMPPLSGARHDLLGDLTKADQQLHDAGTTMQTLRSFLVGPRRLLILGGNNAEMRSVGIATTSGVASVANGAIDVGDFVDASKTYTAPPGVDLPPGWRDLYGFLDPDLAYGNTVCSANFGLTGQVAAELAARNIDGNVDGVVYVDTVALQNLLDVVGPVTVDGITYDSTNAARILINDNYVKFDTADRGARRDAQGRVANAIFDALQTRHVSFVHLAAKLQELGQSRHLMVWSQRADEQTLWEDVGAAGATSSDDLDVTMQDLGGDKLDFYVQPQVNMTVEPDGDDRRVNLTITATNPTRDRTSSYIEGFGTAFTKPGEYGAYLVVFLPHDAFAAMNSDPGFNTVTPDGPLNAAAMTYTIPIGTTRTVHMSFDLPGSTSTIHLLPSARLAPIRWSWGSWHFDDRLPVAIDLSKVRVGPEVSDLWLSVGLLLFGVGAAIAGNSRGRVAVALANGAEGTRLAVRGAKADYEIGFLVLVVGLGMIATQVALFIWR